MAAALYDPDCGYYASGTNPVGRAGDFFTSVSCGPLFGRLLALHFATWWENAGRPAAWRLLECGANDGTLADDILTALRDDAPDAYAAVEYVVSEPLPRNRESQAAKLAQHAGHFRSLPDLTELAAAPLPGFVFGNELLDALPCEIVEWRDNRWLRGKVALDAQQEFCWEFTAELPDELAAALDPLGNPFPDGYRTEIRPALTDILKPWLAALSHGRMLWIDYGFARADYYSPLRRTGTLRTYAKHQAGEDPLAAPGSCDISAHVDFTAVCEAAEKLGAQLRAFIDQGTWLTRLAMPLLRSAPEEITTPEWSRQFQTLVHPAHLGAKFHVIEFAWHENVDALDAGRAKSRL